MKSQSICHIIVLLSVQNKGCFPRISNEKRKSALFKQPWWPCVGQKLNSSSECICTIHFYSLDSHITFTAFSTPPILLNFKQLNVRRKGFIPRILELRHIWPGNFFVKKCCAQFISAENFVRNFHRSGKRWDIFANCCKY